MERSEHVQWSKDRAIEYIEQGDITGGYTSFLSDMSSNPETQSHPFLMVGAIQMFSGQLSTADEMTKWINDFN